MQTANQLITDEGRIRRIDANGIINTIAGNGVSNGFSGNEMEALTATHWVVEYMLEPIHQEPSTSV